MAKTNKNKRHPVATFIALGIIGVLSSCTFVLTALASGIVPSEVIALANSARTKASLAPFSANAQLTEAAQSKANDMIKNDYFAHTSPSGVEPWHWIKQAGYQYKAAGENLAINYTDTREQHEAWMKSETHRANILSTRYQEIGVAVVKGKIDGKESIVTVEMFGTPLVAVADQLTPAPPVIVPAPVEIKGVEMEVGVPLLSEEPVNMKEEIAPLMPEQKRGIPPAPIQPMLSLLLADVIWLPIAWAIALSLSTVVAPVLLISRAYAILMQKPEKSVVAVKKAETPEQTLPSMDGIHKALA